MTDGLDFSRLTIDHLDRTLPWCPLRRRALLWMRTYVESDAACHWFDDLDNYAFRAGGTLFLHMTVLDWLAGFRRDMPLWAWLTVEKIHSSLTDLLPGLFCRLHDAGAFPDINGVRIWIWQSSSLSPP